MPLHPNLTRPLPLPAARRVRWGLRFLGLISWLLVALFWYVALFGGCRAAAPTPISPVPAVVTFTATSVLPTVTPTPSETPTPLPTATERMVISLPAPLYFLGQDQQIWQLAQDGVTVRQLTAAAQPIVDYDVSPVDGSLIYVAGGELPGQPQTPAQLILADAVGQNPQILPTTSQVQNVRWSPAGQWIAYDSAEGIYVTAAGGTPELRLTVEDANSRYTVVSWSPDGNSLLVNQWGQGPGWNSFIFNLQDHSLVGLGQSCCYPSWRQDSSGVYYAMDGLGEVYPGLWFAAATGGKAQTLIKPVNPQSDLLPWVAHPYAHHDTLYAFVGTDLGSGWPFSLTLSQIHADGATTPVRSDAQRPREALWATDGSGALIVDSPNLRAWPPVGKIAWLGVANEPVRLLGQQGYKLRWGVTPPPASSIQPGHVPTATTQAELPPPLQPLLAWNMAPDGVIYVLDAALRVYELAPHTLTPRTRSAPLQPVMSDELAGLSADNERVYLTSRTLSQTLGLRRSDLSVGFRLPIGQKENFGRTAGSTLLAVDPGRRLFVVGEGGVTPWGGRRNALWVYDLTQPEQPPRQLIPADLGDAGFAEPHAVRADLQQRRLYVAVFRAPGTSPRNSRNLQLFDLDSLAPLGDLYFGDGFRFDSLPTIAPAADRLAIMSTSSSAVDRLLVFDRNHLPQRDAPQEPITATEGLTGLPAIDPHGDWIYLLRQTGLWVLRGSDLSLVSLLPFVVAPPTDLWMAPDGETLYLFGNGWQSAMPTAELQTLGLAAVQPFPSVWIPEWLPQNLIFASPQRPDDGTVLRPLFGSGFLRSQDGGASWTPLITYTPGRGPDPLAEQAATAGRYSLSPDFAQDRTVVAGTGSYPSLLRSTDAGATWHGWQPRLAFTSDRRGNRDIFTANPQGEEIRPITVHPASDETPAWSPAWTRLAFASDRSGNWDIYSIRADCAPLTPAQEAACDLRQLTDDPADDLLPAWSPDGRAIAFVSLRDGNAEIYITSSDGATVQRVTHHPAGDWRPVWLPSSLRLAYTSDRKGSNDIFTQAVWSDSTSGFLRPDEYTYEYAAKPLIQNPADERDPAFTAEGQLLFWSDAPVGDEGGGHIAALRISDRTSGERQLVAYPATPGAVGHPSGDASGAALVSVDLGGNVDIYHLSADKATPLIGGPDFEGHPAGAPVWWDPNSPWW